MAPQSAASPKMTTPALPMTPLFYYRILFYSKNVVVELDMLTFDLERYRDAILGSRLHFDVREA